MSSVSRSSQLLNVVATLRYSRRADHQLPHLRGALELSHATRTRYESWRILTRAKRDAQPTARAPMQPVLSTDKCRTYARPTQHRSPPPTFSPPATIRHRRLLSCCSAVIRALQGLSLVCHARTRSLLHVDQTRQHRSLEPAQATSGEQSRFGDELCCSTLIGVEGETRLEMPGWAVRTAGLRRACHVGRFALVIAVLSVRRWGLSVYRREGHRHRHGFAVRMWTAIGSVRGHDQGETGTKAGSHRGSGTVPVAALQRHGVHG